MTEEFDHYSFAMPLAFCHSKHFAEQIKAGQVLWPDCFNGKVPTTMDHRQIVVDDGVDDHGYHLEPPPEVAVRHYKHSMRSWANSQLKRKEQ